MVEVVWALRSSTRRHQQGLCSIRCFKDALRAAGVSEDVNDALTGHAGAGTVGRTYGAKDMLKRFGHGLETPPVSPRPELTGAEALRQPSDRDAARDARG
jgi:hypothetical protein